MLYLNVNNVSQLKARVYGGDPITVREWREGFSHETITNFYKAQHWDRMRNPIHTYNTSSPYTNVGDMRAFHSVNDTIEMQYYDGNTWVNIN